MHVRALQRAGPVVLVLAERPYASWQDGLLAAGVDLDALGVLDIATSQSNVRAAEGGRQVEFLASPTMLELAAMRIERMAKRIQAHAVVIDSLGMVAFHNGADVTLAFLHYLVGRLGVANAVLELIVRDDPDGRLLAQRLSGLVDSHQDLAALSPTRESRASDHPSSA